MANAYLIAICDPTTNTILRTEIWSSPEWEQSRQLAERTYVAWRMSGVTFQDAHDRMVAAISDEQCRYHYLYGYLSELIRSEYEEGTH